MFALQEAHTRTAIDKEGTALMQIKGKEKTKNYPQSAGNLALADESLGVYKEPKAKTRSPQLTVVQRSIEVEAEGDALAPATGIINGIRLSITLWLLILFVVLLMR
jgi:hypothetical protein